MSPQAKRVLKYVKRYDSTYIDWLSHDLGIPVPSIRRCIHEIYKDPSSKYYLETENGIVRAYRG